MGSLPTLLRAGNTVPRASSPPQFGASRTGLEASMPFSIHLQFANRECRAPSVNLLGNVLVQIAFCHVKANLELVAEVGAGVIASPVQIVFLLNAHGSGIARVL